MVADAFPEIVRLREDNLVAAVIIIENPVLNSPFSEPARHWRFTEDGITNEVVEGRRQSSYFVPIADARNRRGQLQFDTEWTQDRIEENRTVNRIRERVSLWRQGGYAGVTATTSRLLRYWTDSTRDRPLFFCQIEAVEAAIYITEVAKRYGDAWIENSLREANDQANPGLPRIALKMATGSGKTVVMAMLIAWHVLNKLHNPQDNRFSDSFLIVTPGITIRDRLRVLLPNDPDNYYRLRDIVPPELTESLGAAKIIITNFHAFSLRERADASRLTKSLLGQARTGAFTETPDQMVRRVCRELGNKRNVVVINDEAHHCYRRRPEAEVERLPTEERAAVKRREEEARVWISGLDAVQAKVGVRAIYDLSATPFFLRGSGYSEGTLFPWVVSDFSLIDAIEAGIVKVPRVPVADNSMTGVLPTYRDIWSRIRADLPKKGRGTEAAMGEPKLPVELEGALRSLYENYEKYYALWETNTEARARGLTAPVFIVVCNNTNVSKLVFDYMAGWEKTLKDGSKVLVPGRLPIFSNVSAGRWTERPNTILVDSEQLESDEGMSAEFKKIAAAEIDEFKAEVRARFPGRDVDAITDEDLLREVMNTVGKPGKLGEHVKCVVSVSMLTEGWDANTVTHVLGVRAFGTQLLCEQVVGRALRRMSYAAEIQRNAVNGSTYEFRGFMPEYAEVYGVPFSFIPCSGSTREPRPGPLPTRVRALEERRACEITFPRLVGYRFEVPDETLSAAFGPESRIALSTATVPTWTENAPVIGEHSIHRLDDLKERREGEVAFLLAKLVLERFFRDDGGEAKPWLFPKVLRITRQWLAECVTTKDDAFKQLLLLHQLAVEAAEKVYRSIVAGEPGSPAVQPILRPYEPTGSTRFVDFDTTRQVYATRTDKCHISHVVGDTGSWEQKTAQALEEMDEVTCYVKNDRQPGFSIPYTLEGEERNYFPDFIARVNDGRGSADPLNLIVEVTGERKKDKEAKVATVQTLWVPAVNNQRGFGRWAFVEITDPWNTKTLVRAALAALATA